MLSWSADSGQRIVTTGDSTRVSTVTGSLVKASNKVLKYMHVTVSTEPSRPRCLREDNDSEARACQPRVNLHQPPEILGHGLHGCSCCFGDVEVPSPRVIERSFGKRSRPNSSKRHPRIPASLSSCESKRSTAIWVKVTMPNVRALGSTE